MRSQDPLVRGGLLLAQPSPQRASTRVTEDYSHRRGYCGRRRVTQRTRAPRVLGIGLARIEPDTERTRGLRVVPEPFAERERGVP
jgi:hypothetical protein